MNNMMTKMAAENPDKYPSRMGQLWKDDEVDKLLTSVHHKKSLEDIAKEHNRTIGGIREELKKLAYEFWKNDKKSIEEIETLTGLSVLVINKTISMRGGLLAKKSEKKHIVSIPEVSVSKFDIQTEITTIKLDMAEMKKDIKELLACMKAAYEFEDA